MRNPIEGKNIVIIGSGIGGLSAGIILSLLNFRVTVVEKNPLPGGLMRSYCRSEFDCPVGVHYVGALGEKEPLAKCSIFWAYRLMNCLPPWDRKASLIVIFLMILLLICPQALTR